MLKLFTQRRLQLLLAGVATVCLLAATAVAVAALLPSAPNDLLALGQGQGQLPAAAPVQRNAEPPLVASPPADCGPGSHPLTGYTDGRVPGSVISSGQAANGFTCNTTLIAHQGHSGGFKVFRYVDPAGHVCAYYDTALLYPLNAISLTGTSQGVAVLDMSDPAHPVQTDTLTSVPMLTPHESLNLNPKRGLLGAVSGNPNTYPGDVAFYSLSQDCRHPVLDFEGVIARFGHESGFSADGNTFYAAGTAVKSITAIDVTDPKTPHVVWQGQESSHGLTLSDDGNRAYLADANGGKLTVLDTSQIQARMASPQASEISSLTWNTVTIPQNAIPFQVHGHPYLLEFDEYASRFSSPAPPDTVGAGRIIDISDEHHPFVVSNLRLQVNQPADHAAASSDPGAISPVQGYAGHYCNVPSEVDPTIVACSFINSGLRIFNIQDLLHPKEVGYYVAPPQPTSENGFMASDFAMSKPAFDVANHSVWYTDGTTGFYVLRMDNGTWPGTGAAVPPPGGKPGVGQKPHGKPSPGPRRVTCTQPTGTLAGSRLGPIALGQTRGAVRAALGRYSTRGRANIDFLCLYGGGIRTGYPSASLLHSLTRSQRASVVGRVVLALTDDRFYNAAGVRFGTTLAAARKLLHLSGPYRIGANVWYLSTVRGSSARVLKVRHNVVQEVGLLDRRLLGSRARNRRVLASFYG